MNARRALLLVDHGSAIAKSNELLAAVADGIKSKRPELIVHVAHMELAAPTIDEGFSACVQDGADEIVVHPYMLVPGRHAIQDVPRIVQQVAAKHPGTSFRVTAPLGLHDKIWDVVLERSAL